MKSTNGLLLAIMMVAASAASANQDLKIEAPEKPAAKAEVQKNSVLINNRSYYVESAPAAAPKVRSFSIREDDGAVTASEAVETEAVLPLITKGTTLTSVVTGQPVTVTGRFTVLLDRGVDAEDFADKHGLSVYRQMGNSRLVILEADESVNLLDVNATLRKASGLSSVKIELLENLMQPL
ncbi:hypothetical protein ACWJJH_03900 [Endozoicomonadaceae bacterium StTr2]